MRCMHLLVARGHCYGNSGVCVISYQLVYYLPAQYYCSVNKDAIYFQAHVSVLTAFHEHLMLL